MSVEKKPLLSIIVPVYNVEYYLEKCVQSIIDQTMTDIEIILVDDGSPDQCGKMCDEYAEHDSRIVVIHKENGGLSDARNKGLDVAKADYVAFVDSDDYIDRDMMELLYSNILREDADISVCGVYNEFGEAVYPTKDTLGGFYVADSKEAVRLELTEVPITAVNKIYKKALFDKIRFPKGKLYEDAHTITPVLLIANKVVYDLKPKYHYIHRENSITTKAYRPQVLSLIEANKNNMELICARYPELRDAAEFRYFWSYFWILEYMLRSPDLDDEAIRKKKEIYRLLKANTFKIVKNPFFSKTRKISALILFVNSGLYERTAKKYMQRKYDNPSSIMN